MNKKCLLFLTVLLSFLSCTPTTSTKQKFAVVTPIQAVAVVRAEGHVADSRQLPLYFAGNGLVRSVPVHAGSVVRQGDTLVVFDAREAKNNVTRSKAILDQAKLHLEKMQTTERTIAEQNVAKARLHEGALEKELEQSGELFRQGAISNKVHEAAQNDYETAKADRIIAEAHLTNVTLTEPQLLSIAVQQAGVVYSNALAATSDAVLTAPVDGIVLEVSVTEGGRSSADVPAVVLYPHTESGVIKAQVAGDAIGRIKKGQLAYLSNAGASDKQARAVVTAVAAGAGAVPGESTIFLMEESADSLMNAAGSFLVTVITDTVSAALVLDADYLQFKGETASVNLRRGSVFEKREIHYREAFDGRYIIDAGIAAGDTVASFL